MSSVRNFTKSFIRLALIIFVGLSAQGSYGQAVSFDLDYLMKTKVSSNTSQFYRKGYTSELLAHPEYKDIMEKSKRLKLNIEKRKQKRISHNIGDEKEFFVRNILTGNTWLTTTAVLSFKNSQVNIWVQKSAYDTLNNTQDFQNILNGFDELLFNSTPINSIDSEKGVLEILNDYVGKFPNVDGDETLDVLLLDIQDNFEETGSFVAGFFDPVNLFEFEFSNEMDLIYLDLYPTVLFNEEVNVERAVSTFAHESQHLIHAGYEGEEPELVFINEGFSEAVEILCGFEPRSEEGYQKFPLRGLLSWNYENPIPDYSRASLWTHYLIEQLGPSSLKTLVQNPRIGYLGYEEIIESSSAYTFEETFRNWGIALLINNTDKQREFGYIHPQRREPVLLTSLSVSRLPVAFSGAMPGLVHIPVGFNLTSELNFEIGNPASGNTWVNSISKYPATEEIEIQISDSPFIATTAQKFKYGDIETLISFVGEPDVTETQSLSFYSEGIKSGRVLEREYGDGNPDTFYQNASYLSLNNVNQRIGVVFAPTQTTYWLKELGIRTLFKSELEGSGVDGGETRDFEVDIFTFTQGKPDQQLIPTTKINATRESGKLVEEVFSLSDFYVELSSISDSIIIIIGNDEDDQNFIALGMDKGTENASFFSEATDSWVSLSEKSIGSNSLSNWNPVIQMNAVLPEVREENTTAIQEIEYNFNEVLIKVMPVEEYDTTSVHLIAKLPDGSFRKGGLSSKEDNGYIFTLPVLVNGSYTLTAGYQSPDSEITYTDQQEWSIEIPDGFELSNNYPNPFNPSTTIPFILLEEATIEWEVFDVLGRRVTGVDPRLFTSGEHRQEFNLNGFASGMYIVRATLERERDGTTKFRTQKIMLIK